MSDNERKFITIEQLQVCLAAATDRLMKYDNAMDLRNLCERYGAEFHGDLENIVGQFENFGAHIRGDFKNVTVHKPKS